MQVALVHEVDPDLFPVTVRKEDIVRKDDRRPGLTVCLEASIDVLQEVQLLITGGESEVIAGRPLTALLGSEWRICQDDVKIFHALADRGKSIAKGDLPIHIVEHGVHQGQPMRIVDQLAAGKGLAPFKGRRVCIEIEEIVRVVGHILVSRNHEAEGTAGWIVAALARLRLNHPGHDIDQHTGCEILAGSGLLLSGVLFQQALIEIPQAFFLGGIPVETVNRRDDLLQVLRLIDIRHRTRIDLLHAAPAIGPEDPQQILIIIVEVDS